MEEHISTTPVRLSCFCHHKVSIQFGRTPHASTGVVEDMINECDRRQPSDLEMVSDPESMMGLYTASEIRTVPSLEHMASLQAASSVPPFMGGLQILSIVQPTVTGQTASVVHFSPSAGLQTVSAVQSSLSGLQTVGGIVPAVGMLHYDVNYPQLEHVGKIKVSAQNRQTRRKAFSIGSSIGRITHGETSSLPCIQFSLNYLLTTLQSRTTLSF